MLLSFLYFEWRCALHCCKRCLAKCSSGGKSKITVHSDDNGDKKTAGELRQSHGDNRGWQEDDMGDDQMMHNLNLLYQKSKKNEMSYGDHGFEGHDYASNRQN